MLPVRDAETTLGDALTSVRQQTFEDFECLIVDDGSQDRSAEIARAVSREDQRFGLLRNASPGLVQALNLGLERAQGRWVARLDADDRMHPERLSMQLRALVEHPSWLGTGCHVELFPRGRLGKGRLQYERWLNSMFTANDVRRERFVECPLAHPTWLFRRDLLVEYRYRDFSGPEDYDLMLRVLGAGHDVGVVPHKLLAWRDHPTRLSRVNPRYDIERFVELKAAHLASEYLDRDRRYVLVGYGKTGKKLAKELRRRGYHPSHIVEVHVGRIGQRIAGVPVVGLGELAHLEARRSIVSVAGLEARTRLRALLHQMGMKEERDFVCAA